MLLFRIRECFLPCITKSIRNICLNCPCNELHIQLGNPAGWEALRCLNLNHGNGEDLVLVPGVHATAALAGADMLEHI